MFRFLLRRLGQTLAVLVTVSVIVFFVIRLIPGDPVMTMLGNEYTEQAYRDLRDKLGLDRPIAVQYAMWLRDLARGDLGYSNLLHEEVRVLVYDAFLPTLETMMTTSGLVTLERVQVIRYGKA